MNASIQNYIENQYQNSISKQFLSSKFSFLSLLHCLIPFVKHFFLISCYSSVLRYIVIQMERHFTSGSYGSLYAQLEEEHKQQLQSRFTITHPDLKCSCSALITYICSNPTCVHYALFCQNQQCTSYAQHAQCERSKLQDITGLLQSRSAELKRFLETFFNTQNRLIQAAMKRRSKYIQEVYTCGLDRRHLDIIETIYFKRKTETQVQGCYADDLEEELRGSNAFIERSLSKDHLQPYNEELERINDEMQALERIIFDSLIQERTPRELEISRYGYYDITSAMLKVPHAERREINHLIITNTCIWQLTQAQIQSQLQSRYWLIQQYEVKDIAQIPENSDAAVLSAHIIEQRQKRMQLQYLKDTGKSNLPLILGRNVAIHQINRQIQQYNLFDSPGLVNIQINSHEFNNWQCFDNLASIINRKLLRLQQLELYVGHNLSKEEHINWAEKLRKNIKVRIKEFGREGLKSKIVLTR